MSAALTRSSWRVDADLSDDDLIAATRAGDGNAYGVLWDRHSPAAMRVARAITSSIDPDDLVSEAFAKTLSAIRNGGGPTDAFRPYLFAAVRSAAATWGGRQKDIALEYIDELPVDDAEDSLDVMSDRALVVSAFKDLPERWRTLLWYLEVEGMKPREVAPLMGLSPNAVSVLAARAREGFKTAWLQAHIAAPERDPECRWTCERIIAHSRRRRIARADRARFDAHLESCRQCTIASVEVSEASSKLRAVLLPLIIGGPAAALYSAGSPAPASASVAASEGAKHLAPWLIAAGAVVAVGAGAVAFAGQLLPDGPPDSGGSAPTSVVADGQSTASPDDDASSDDVVDAPLPAPVPVTEPVRDAPPPADETPITAPVPQVTSPPGPRAPEPRDDAAAPTVEQPLPPAAPSAPPQIGPTPPVAEPPTTPRASPTPTPTPDPTPSPTPTPPEEPEEFPVTIVWSIPQPATIPPDATGTGTPGDRVEILDESGLVVGTTVVDDDGTFAVPIAPESLHQGMTIRARQTSSAGRQSLSDAVGPVVFDLPSVLGAGWQRVLDRTDLDLDGRSDDAQITVHGIAGASVLVSVDGEPLPVSVLAQGTAIHDVLDIRPGLHRITLRYVDPVTGARGPEAVEGILVRP